MVLLALLNIVIAELYYVILLHCDSAGASAVFLIVCIYFRKRLCFNYFVLYRSLSCSVSVVNLPYACCVFHTCPYL